MRIAYVNPAYKKNHIGGGLVHIGQFVTNADVIGHDVWTYAGNEYPDANNIPTGHIDHIKTMRKMDALYIRLESEFPTICKWSLPLRRSLYGFPLVVWEFNTIPEDATFRGLSTGDMENSVRLYRRFTRLSPGNLCGAVHSQVCK